MSHFAIGWLIVCVYPRDASMQVSTRDKKAIMSETNLYELVLGGFAVVCNKTECVRLGFCTTLSKKK